MADSTTLSDLVGGLYYDHRPWTKDSYVVTIGTSHDRPGVDLCIGIGLPSGAQLRIHPQRLLSEVGFELIVRLPAVTAALLGGYVLAAHDWMEQNAAQD